MRDIHYPLSKWGKSLQSINRDACAWSNFCAGKMQKIFLHPVAGMPLPFITIDFHKGVNLHSAPPPCFNLHAQKSVQAHASATSGCRDLTPLPVSGDRIVGSHVTTVTTVTVEPKHQHRRDGCDGCLRVISPGKVRTGMVGLARCKGQAGRRN